MDTSHRLRALNLQQADLEALGALTVHYSHMEFFAAIGVWSLLKLGIHEGSAITSKLNLRQRLELIIELGPARGLTLQDVAEVQAILREFDRKDGLTTRRNELIHGVWATDEKGENAFPINFPRAGGARSGANTTAEEIEAVTKAVCGEARKLQQLLHRNGLLLTGGVVFSPQLPSSLEKP
jgi:hypothetical protein